jgi:hypothetical protein
MIETGPLRPEDRAAWEVLARGYKTFYRESEPDEAYEQTWRRLAAGTELFGLGARLDGRLVGIAHYVFHPAVWSGEACYLQDLFTDVAAAARERGADRFYWHTQESNTRARVLYDKVARFTGFIRYAYPL